MSILTRLLRLCKADVHGVMDQLEDKALLLRQYLREMEASLADKKRQLEALTRRMDRLYSQAAHNNQEMEKIEQDLTLAITKEKDEIARMLIRRRRAIEATCIYMKQQIEALSKEKDRLSDTLSRQHLEYETLKSQAETYTRRFNRKPSGAPEDIFTGTNYVSEPCEADVELELLQRKESLAAGGRS